jgi:hypothetical protein
MSLSGRARDLGVQTLHYIRKRMRVNDPSFLNGVKIGRLPGRAFLFGSAWYKEAAFNSTATDTIQIGTTQGGSDILAATDVHSTGFTAHTAAAGLGGAVTFVPNEVDVWVKWTSGGGSPSTGDVTVIILFAPDNDS